MTRGTTIRKDDFDFSDFAIQSVEITAPDGKKYTLREADGAAARRFNNAKTNRIKFTGGKPSAFEDIGDLEPLLVSMCLFDSKNKPVHQSIIEGWPSKVVRRLFDKCKEMSELDDKVESPVEQAVRVAFWKPEVPVTRSAYVEWLKSLEDDSVQPLIDLLTEKGDEAKNERSSTTDG